MNADSMIHGDCLEEMGIMGTESVDYVFTSPPYNRLRNDKYQHYDDTVKDWGGWMEAIIREAIRVSQHHAIFNLQINSYNRPDVLHLLGVFAGDIKEIVVWEKSNPLPANGLNITNAVEYFMFFGGGPVRANKSYTKNILTTAVNGEMPAMHKAVMKQEVADYMIENFTKPGHMVLDCFMGLGTTGISCRRLGRHFIGIEKVKEYHDEAVKRIEGEFCFTPKGAK